MSDEIKNPGMELNDAALESVSGGVSDTLIDAATTTCKNCLYNHNGDRRCSATVEDLAAYMEKNHRPITEWSHCPFQPWKNR